MFQFTAAHRLQDTARSVKALLALAMALVLAGLTAAAASAATPPDQPGISPPPANARALGADQARNAAAPQVDPEAAKALAKSKGISTEQAEARLAREQSLGVKGAKIVDALAGRSGGSFLDSDGNLVVTAVDKAANAIAKQHGARTKLVDDSSAKLDGIVKQLDRQAKSGMGAVQGWRVDVPTNTVIVTVTQGATDANTAALTKLARSFGDSVRIEEKPAAEAPKPAAAFTGGLEFRNNWNNGTCSIGFNTRDAYNRNVVLTAGHCTNRNGWFSRSGYWIGNTRNANFPADDFGTFWNNYPGYWVPSPSVYAYNGTYIRVAGSWVNPPVGATVCKSGRTTGYTCGTITAHNQTVNYGAQGVVYGMTRHNACVEGGDSGGSNISAGRYALGLTSGASMISGKCLSKYGYANVSWYQPIGEALTRNGLRLVL